MSHDTLLRDVGVDSTALLLRAVRRRWYLIVLFPLVVVSAAYVYTSGLPNSYRSDAMVLVTPVGVLADQPERGDAVDMDTEVVLVKSEPVARAARRLMAVDTSTTALIRRVNVTVPPNTRVLQIEYVGTTAVEAQQGAHSFAQAYLEERSAEARAMVTKRVDALETVTKQLEVRLAEVAEKISSLPASSPEAVVAQAQRMVLINQISAIEAKAGPLRAVPTNGGVITRDARLPTQPAGHAMAQNLGGGGLVGLALGLLLALLLDRLDDRVRDPEEIQRLFDLPVLTHASSVRRSPVALVDPMSLVGQMFSELRNILQTNVSGPRVFVLFGSEHGNSCGFATANLARAFMRTDLDVLVVVADERSPSAALLGMDRGHTAPGDDPFPAYRTDSPRISVCLPRVDFDGGFDWISPGMFAEFTAGRERRADVILVDAPPITEGPRARGMLRQASTSLLVVEARRSKAGQVRSTLRAVERLGARIHGVVMTPPLSRSEAAAGLRGTGDPTPPQAPLVLSREA